MKKLPGFQIFFKLSCILLLGIFFTQPIFADLQNGSTITATVPANASNFQFSFAETSGSNPVISTKSTLVYEITYGNTASIEAPVTLTATWTTGTIQDGSGATIDVTDYQSGSATNAYNNTPPVVDLANKTITWTMSELPGNTTNQTVQFILNTNSNYSGTSNVTFSVTGQLSSVAITLPSTTLTKTFRNFPGTPGSSSNSSSSNASSTTNTSSIPQTTPLPSNLSITGVTLHSVTNNSVEFSIGTSVPTTLSVQHGTSITNLNKTITDPSLTRVHDIIIPNLEANTVYYFQFIITDSSGRSIKSEIYEIRTARESTTSHIDLSSIVLTSSDVVLTTGKQPQPVIILAKGTPFTLNFSVDQAKGLKQIRAFLREKNVLGISIGIPLANAESTSQFPETALETYQGRLAAPTAQGIYELYIQLADTNVNIIEQKIGEIMSNSPITIFDAETKKPIEKAKITIALYQPNTKEFQVLSSEQFPIKNPAFSNPEGQVKTTLPEGVYRVLVEAIGYKTKSVDFKISGTEGDRYPQIFLEKSSFSLLTAILYYSSIGGDALTNLLNAASATAISHRMFDLFSLIILSVLAGITVFAYSIRSNTPLYKLPLFLWESFSRKPHKIKSITGTVSHKGSPVAGAHIFLRDQSGTAVAHTITNSNGIFQLDRVKELPYSILAVKSGFETTIHSLPSDTRKITIPLVEGTSIHHHSLTVWYIRDVLDIGFESLLLLSIGFEILATFTLGLSATGIFIIISILNFILWVQHLRIKQQENAAL